MKWVSDAMLQRVAIVTDFLLLLQMALLILVLHTVTKLHTSIISRCRGAAHSTVPTPETSAVAGPAAAAAAAKQRSSGSSRPTVETLLPEPQKAVVQPLIPEWEPISAEELAVLADIKHWLPDEFAKLPADLLVTFVRGFRYRTDWQRASVAFLAQTLEWRAQVGADRPVPIMLRSGAQLPPKERSSRSTSRPAPSASTGPAIRSSWSAPASSRRATCSGRSTRS